HATEDTEDTGEIQGMILPSMSPVSSVVERLVERLILQCSLTSHASPEPARTRARLRAAAGRMCCRRLAADRHALRSEDLAPAGQTRAERFEAGRGVVVCPRWARRRSNPGGNDRSNQICDEIWRTAARQPELSRAQPRDVPRAVARWRAPGPGSRHA